MSWAACWAMSAGTCWYRLIVVAMLAWPSLQVGVLDATTIDGGGTALHLVVHGPVAEQRNDGAGGSSVRTASFTIADASGVWQVEAQPGATWGEVYVEVPATSPSHVEMSVAGPTMKEPRSFVVDTASLLRSCDF